MPRPRTPNALKVLKGTVQPCRMRDEAEFPPLEGTEPPDWLMDAEAVAEWNRRIGHMDAAGIATEADLIALGHYCNLHAWCAKRWRLGDKPPDSTLGQLRQYANEFGFTPASRSKPAKTGDKGRKNPFEELGKKSA